LSAQPAATSPPAPAAAPLARIVFAALVVACFAAFAITQHLKHTPSAVQDFKGPYVFEPSGPPGSHRVEALSFRIAKSDEVTVEIIDSSGNVVATLLHDRPLHGYTTLSYQWDGRRGPTTPPAPAAGTPHDRLKPVDHGALAPRGEYRVRVHLLQQDRTVPSPRSFELR
jgi:hypothetical protein